MICGSTEKKTDERTNGDGGLKLDLRLESRERGASDAHANFTFQNSKMLMNSFQLKLCAAFAATCLFSRRARILNI
jgi:hypothetical protein